MNTPFKNPSDFLVCIVFLLNIPFLQCLAQIPEWEWAKSSDERAADCIITDKSGHVYVAGTTAIIKYDPMGAIVWTSSPGTGGEAWVEGLAVDDDNNLYVTGSFADTSIVFGNDTLKNIIGDLPFAAWFGMFVAKYDPDGNVVWAISPNGSHRSGGSAITVGADRGIFVTGFFTSDSLRIGNNSFKKSVPEKFSSDMFIVKYDQSGDVVWSRSIAGEYDEYPQSMAIDQSENIYVAGNFNSPALSIGNTTLTNNGDDDIFIAKYTSNGEVLWVRSAGGKSGETVKGITVDNNGNVAATGAFSDSVSFGATLLKTQGAVDIFLVKYDSDGNLLWARSAGSTEYEGGNSITADKNGNLYITGYLTNLTSFGTIMIGTPGAGDIFLAKYTADGNVAWAESIIGEDNAEMGNGITADTDNHIYISGSFGSKSIRFGKTTLNNPDNTFPTFIAKLDASATSISEFHNDFTPTLFPNPTASQFHIANLEPGNWTFTIYTLDGQSVFKKEITESNAMIDLSGKAKGAYVYRLLKDGEVFKTGKLILE